MHHDFRTRDPACGLVKYSPLTRHFSGVDQCWLVILEGLCEGRVVCVGKTKVKVRRSMSVEVLVLVRKGALDASANDV